MRCARSGPSWSARGVIGAGVVLAVACGDGGKGGGDGSAAGGGAGEEGATGSRGGGGERPGVGGGAAAAPASGGGGATGGAAVLGGVANAGGSLSGGTDGTGAAATGGTNPGTGGAGTGGASTGGVSTGGASTGGAPVTGGGPGTGGTGGLNTDCSDAASFDAVVRLEGNTWTATRGETTVYTGTNMMDAMQAGVNSLTPGRTSKESVIVCGSGTVGPYDGSGSSFVKAVNLPDYTVLDVRGTVRVEDTNDANYVPVQCRGAQHIEVPNLRVEGNPRYSIWIQSCTDVHLGHIELQHWNVLQIGLGIRIDAARGPRSRDVTIDYVWADRTGSHGIETAGVDNLEIGYVKAENTGECGLLLQGTTHARVGTVDAIGAGTGTGYAALRFANEAGPDIHVERVVARGGGRGIFCVSQSRGITIDELDVANTGGQAILIENCYDVNLAAVTGTVEGAEVRIASRSEFPPSSNVTLENLTVTNAGIREAPCDGTDNVVRNNVLVDSTLTLCPGTDGGGNVVR